MKPKVLIITDNITCKFVEHYSDNEYLHILTLGFPGFQLLNTHRFQQKCLDFKYQLIDLNKIKSDAQKLTIKYCLDIKSKYSKLMNIKNSIFSYNGISSWWFTAFSEMGSFRIDFVEKIYLLTLVKLTHIDEYELIHLDIKDAELLKTMRKYLGDCGNNYLFEKNGKHIYYCVKNRLFFVNWLLNSIYFILRQLIKLFVIKTFDIGFNPKTNMKRVLFFSFYPSLWKKSKSDVYEFRIFNDIMKKSNNRIIANYLIYTLSIKSLFKTILPDRNIFKMQEIILVEKYLNIFDILSILNLKILKQIFKYIKFSKHSISEKYFEFDTSNMIINAINKSLLIDEYHQDMLIFKSINKLLNRIDIHGIVHASEFQCYEKAIWYACKKKCKSYAVQHSAIGRNWTNYYFNKSELSNYNKFDISSYMPLPDYYMTAGKYPYNIMLENGLDKEMLKLVGAIRYDSLSEFIKNNNNEDHKVSKEENVDFNILILTSVDSTESLNMVSSVLSLTQNDYLFSFKSHPLNILDLEIEQLFKDHHCLDQLNIIPSERNYYDKICESDLVIFCNSTIGIESIALGVPSISFESYNSIKSYDIIEVGESLFRATNSFEIENAINNVRRNNDILYKRMSTWKTTISDTFYKLDGLSGNRLIEVIDNNINIYK